MKWRKKRKKHGETKKENKWIEDEQKEGTKRQNRHSKRENVELEKEHTVSLSLSQKKDSKKRKLFRKILFFQMTGKYVKGEDKEGTEKG